MFRHLCNSLKIVSASALILSGSFFVQHDVAMAGGFAQTCQNFGVANTPNGTYLQADCANTNGTYLSASLRLTDYIANYSGNLAWAKQGNFSASCYNTTLWFYGRDVMITATCGNGNGGINNSDINLNSKISNQNGVLAPDF